MRQVWCALSVVGMLVVPVSGMAATLQLDGIFQQGGLAVGGADPGAAVTLDGAQVPTTEAGAFIIGFGRDAGPQAELMVTAPDGTVARRLLTISARQYDIQRIDGLPRRKVTPDPEDLKRIKTESRLMVAARGVIRTELLFPGRFIWPARGRISGVYGSQRILNGEPRRPHFGVDVAASIGTPVIAPADGIVTLVHPGMFFNGKVIVLDHGLGLNSVYLHLSATSVKQGQRVRQGMLIGRIGKTGRVTGSHLHWGVRWRSTEIDPALLVVEPLKP